MSAITIALPEARWDDIVAALSDPRETAAVLLAGEAETAHGLVLTVSRVVWVPEEAYEVRTDRELQIASRGWMPALRIASDGGWLPIFLHTHPGSTAASSGRDDLVDEQLSDVFRIRVGRSRYASLIVGGTPDRPTFTGNAFEADSEPKAISRLRAAGRRLRIQDAEDDEAEAPAFDVFDRHLRAFGAEGQRVLHDLRVGVVGCGGTGSAVLEQLTRLGVGSLTFVDHDVVTDTNITRIHGSTMADVGRPKVDVLHDHLDEIGLGTALTRVEGNVTHREVMERLRGCDLIFGCTDDDGGRAVLSRLAYWYLIPVIDMAVVIKSNEGLVSGIFGRITTATPGQPCLLCRGAVDPDRAREEQYSHNERAALVGEGYARGLADRDPAVVAYTTMVASHAVADMLQRLFGFGDRAIPGKQLIRISDREIRCQQGTARDGCYCATPAKWGQADRRSALGITWAS
jgi:molybdopterin/thiamine biosynthesis adenylyltransferase